jgi:hypothetical protein
MQMTASSIARHGSTGGISVASSDVISVASSDGISVSCSVGGSWNNIPAKKGDQDESSATSEDLLVEGCP